MTIRKTDVITLPKWLVILILPLLIGGMGGYASSSFSRGAQAKQIEVNTKRLEVVETDKADMALYKTIEKSLTRIEGKLDAHIDKK
jgi:hypothetical protein